MTTLSDLPPLDNGGPTFGAMQTDSLWPLQVAVFWEQVKLGFKYGGYETFTAANPAFWEDGKPVISKSAMMDMISGPARRFRPPHICIKREPGELPRDEIARAMERAGFTFPAVAKPDYGSKGFGVWSIKDWAVLERYWTAFPVGAHILLQRKVPFEPEAGVFYIRDPETDEAQIFSLSFKYAPAVVGDGESTIRMLIEADPRLAPNVEVFMSKPTYDPVRVPGDGERVPLSFVVNYDAGALYREVPEFATPKLLAAFDEISRSMGEFYFGRYDVRFESVEQLKEGEGFEVVEVNGALSLPGGIIDNRYTLDKATECLKDMYRHAYRIGAYHRRHGVKIGGLIQQYREYFRYVDLTKQYPPSE